MPEIKIQHVVSYSSQDTNNPAENLLKPDGSHKWKCAKVGEKQSSVVLQFEKASIIHSIDIGNDSSAFVEILVGRSSSDKDFQVILVASSFMSPLESRNNTNKYSVRMFGADKLSKTVVSEKWDRIKVVCTQPFNKNVMYGLSFIKFHSPPEKPTASTTNTAETNNDDLVNPKKIGAFFFRNDEEANDVKVGSLFARHKEKPESPPLTVTASIREASNEVRSKYADKKNSNSSPHTPTTSGTKTKRKHDLSDDEDGAEEKKGKYNRNSEHQTSRSKDEEKSTHRHKEEHEKSKHSREKEEKKERKSSHRDDSKHHRESSNSHHNNSTTSKSQSSKVQESSKGVKPFHKILEGVVFVLSGFQNPFRAELRDKAIEMGAKYRPDWMDGCTHLVCAFANTPKYAQVKGKGRIVTKHWITDCYKQKTMLYWKKYRLVDTELGKEASGDEDKPRKSSPDDSLQKTDSERKESNQDPECVPSKKDEDQSDEEESEDDTDDEVRRVKEAESKKKSAKKSPEPVPSTSSFGGSTFPLEEKTNEGEGGDEYDIATDIDEDDSGSDAELPELPDFLAKKHFFLYGALGEKERHTLTRYVVAYNGELEDYMNEKVDFVITAESWDDNFDEALNNYPQLTFVRPRWLYKCNENSKWVPYQPHIVIP